MGAVLMAAVSIRGEAAGLGESLSEGIATNFDQTTNTEEETKATAEVVWTGTPLEGYVNIGIANVEDNLNIRSEADTESKLVGKLRKDSACEILGTEGDGLAADTIADCDYRVRIPMAPGVDSLNVAAASAVAFWELQKGKKDKKEKEL